MLPAHGLSPFSRSDNVETKQIWVETTGAEAGRIEPSLSRALNCGVLECLRATHIRHVFRFSVWTDIDAKNYRSLNHGLIDH